MGMATVDKFIDAEYDILSAGDEMPAEVRNWGDVSFGSINTSRGGITVDGYIIFYDPDDPHWPVLTTIPFREEKKQPLPREIGGQHIYRWTNSDKSVGQLSLDRRVVEFDGDLMFEMDEGEVVFF